MKIKVTQEHIESGERGMCDTCPVALAARDVVGKPAMVWTQTIVVGRKVLCIPESVSEWIKRFDKGEEVSPISFNLN